MIKEKEAQRGKIFWSVLFSEANSGHKSMGSLLLSKSIIRCVSGQALRSTELHRKGCVPSLVCFLFSTFQPYVPYAEELEKVTIYLSKVVNHGHSVPEWRDRDRSGRCQITG